MEVIDPQARPLLASRWPSPRPIHLTGRQNSTSSVSPSSLEAPRPRASLCTRVSWLAIMSAPEKWFAMLWWSMALKAPQTITHLLKSFLTKVSLVSHRFKLLHIQMILPGFLFSRIGHSSQRQCVLRCQHSIRPKLYSSWEKRWLRCQFTGCFQWRRCRRRIHVNTQIRTTQRKSGCQ